MAKRCQPKWIPSTATKQIPLKLFNSLTRQKEEFVPQNGKQITWYSCGPTVYDASHMGHARSYISFDILRRVLSEYFGYDIFYVMNITDVDDKIIKRARQQHLYDNYVANPVDLEQVLIDAQEAMEQFSALVKVTTDPDKKCMMEKMLERLTICVEELQTAVKNNDHTLIKDAQIKLLNEAKDPISEWLDRKLGATVTDNSIFTGLPRHWEKEFHKDMDSLNVLRPNVLTRVSEYIPEIVEYIQQIISNGLAYEANGSVYFDVNAFDKKDIHHYAKLVPEAYGDSKCLQEGEGELSSGDQGSEKRSPTDFALWKCSKVGEPAWESPWGMGRPGWHIECSAMASAVCGPTLDIHTGGVDLKFPHHDNEIAQSEAYFGNSDWVKYFLHSGHLTIAGCKMSKSLKNFVSIQDALQKYNARQLRLAFLLHAWKDTLDYSENTMDMAVQYERALNEFFLTIKCVTRMICGGTALNTFSKWEKPELDLHKKLSVTKENVHAALCDNIDTRTALDCLRELVTFTNIYLRERKPPAFLLLQDVAAYITRILEVFGAIHTPMKVGFPISNEPAVNTERLLLPYLTILSEFRDAIRTHARELKAGNILTECDRLRDDILPNVGVRLEDREGEPSAVKLVDRETLLRERDSKKQLEREKAAEKEKKKAELAAAQALKDAQRKIPPNELFKNETDKYSQFDSAGLPTHDKEGKELSKGLVKKLQKLQIAQEKKYNEYVSTLNGNS